MKKNRILLICCKFSPVSETFIRNQIDFLIFDGREVDIFATSYVINNHLIDKYERIFGMNSNINQVLYFPYYFIKFFIKCPLLLLKSLNFFKYGKEAWQLKLFYSIIFFYNKKYDSIITHFGRSGNVGAFIKSHWMQNTKLFSFFHGMDIREGIKSNGKIYNDLFQNADNILSISSYNYNYLKKWGAKNIRHHPNGVDTSYFKKNYFKKKFNEFTILSVGRLVPEKGYFYALDAFSKLIKEYPFIKIKYDIIGRGVLEKKIKTYIEKYNLKNHVFLHGAKIGDDLLSFYQRADVFLLSSIAEALPVVILEASACELPIIATDVGGISEEVGDKKSGFLVPANDSDAIYKRLKILINNRKKRLELGKKGREIVCRKFDSTKINKKLLNLIDDYKNSDF
jgi:colanic acid/amylovoran biosynthesis glycosyltransferase